MNINRKELVEQAIHNIKIGKIIILVDDEDRENEGDFIQSAQKVSPQSINFMISEGRGLVCCPIAREIATRLALEAQVARNSSLHHTAFTVSIDAIKNTTTGVSALDRATTITMLADNNTVASDLARPGHIFPIVAHDDGILVRKGHTEAAIELVQYAGHRPVATICEILNSEGNAANIVQLEKIAKLHNLVLLHIEDLLLYKKQYQ